MPEASVDALNRALLASDSATAALERWCEAHGLAEPAQVVAQRLDGPGGKPDPAVLRHLEPGAGETVRYRRVRLCCGALVLSEAENWYVPERLPDTLNWQLERTDTPFGRVLRSLGFQRRTLAVDVPPDVAGPGPAGPVPRRRPILRHHVLLLLLPCGTPISEVVETYTSDLLRAAPAAMPTGR